MNEKVQLALRVVTRLENAVPVTFTAAPVPVSGISGAGSEALLEAIVTRDSAMLLAPLVSGVVAVARIVTWPALLRTSTGRIVVPGTLNVGAEALITGEDITADALGNTGNPDRIANPDNLKFSEKMRTLFIGEDSSQHVNNFLWAYHIDTKVLSRVMSIPAGGESTGLHAVDELNGWTYIMSNFQHPGDWGGIHNVVKSTLDPLIKANYKDKFGAAVGYLTGEVAQVKLSKA